MRIQSSILDGTSILDGVRLSPAATIPRIEFRSDLPLSFAQEQLWFLAQMEGGINAYQYLRCLHLRGELNRTALGQALNQIVARHEALRTVFTPVDGRPVQQIAGKHESHFHLIEHDLQECDQAAEELDRLVAEENRTPFDLETGPLIRGRLIRQAEQDHILLITIHHIISDAWSFGIFSNELSAIYSALVRGEADPLPELNVQYADYAVWQRECVEGRILREQVEYWKTALAGAPALLQLPTDHVRPAQQSYRGALVELTLDEELKAGLKELGRRHGTTLFMTALAGWAALLARLSGQQDVVIGTPTANRRRLEIENLIGFFVNMLPFRLHVSDSLSVGKLLAHVKSQVIAAQRHQDIPFEGVVEVIRPVRSLAHSPVFQVMFTWQNAPKGTIDLPGLQVSPLPLAPHTVSKFDLTLSLQEVGDKVVGCLEYATALFERATVERYLSYFRTLLQSMVSDDAQEVGRLDILPEWERRQALYEWNATDVEYPAAGSRREKCVHELFEEQVEKTPDAVAVVFENDSLCYTELNRRANRLAHYLRGLGVGPDARVAVCVERSLEMVIGLLAILKAGGAYVPLDPAYPTERLRQILADAAPRIALSDAIGREALGAGALEDVPALDLDTPSVWMELSAGNPDPRELGLTSGNLAYVIYTSGSTGMPKGVMVEHGNVVNFLCSMSAEPGITAQDRLLAVTNLSFDIAGLELYLPLSKGAQMVIASRRTSADPYLLQRAVLNHRISVMQATPATWRALLDADLQRFPDLTILCGGEALTYDLSSRLPDQGKSAWNLYGPTETTIWSSYTRILRRGNDLSANQCIGRPIGNTQIYILDGRGEPAPMGVIGELYIGGAGVARGYLNRPDLTAERFLKDPFVADANARMYKTGDLGRRLPDGTIEFLGRNDFQVKIRGFRIELGEIETRLAEHEAVREAVVIAREDAPGDKRLAAYYTAVEQAEDGVGAEALRKHLLARLPEYMLPAAYVRLEKLPLTPNGKVDRKALPAPEGDAYVARGYEEPVGEVETLLAGIWAELLKLERVGRHDNFFELGGHSLLAMRSLARLRQALGVGVGISQLFAHPSLAGLAQSLGNAARADLPELRPMERPDRLPLSFAQQRLWFLAQMPGVSQAYHIPIGLRLRGEADLSALRRALDCVLVRHEALRTTFVVVDGEPAQRIASPEESRFLLQEYDLRRRKDAAAELDRLTAEEAGAPFDLEAGPLIRGRLIRLAEDEYALLITMHHIVSDGWSIGVLLGELSAFYAAFAGGEPATLPKSEAQYADYTLWQRKCMAGEALRRQAEYWESALAGAPALLELPVDHPRPAQQDHAGAFLDVALDEGLTTGLKALSRRHGATLFMTLLAGWAGLLARLSGQQDVVIGAPTANRNQVEIEGLIGFFVNTLALRVDVSGEPTVGVLLERVKRQVLAAQQHQDIPFEQVVELARPVRSLSHSPVFQVMFAWQNAPREKINFPGLQVSSLPVPHAVSKFDLTLSLREAGDKIVGGVEYAAALFEPVTVERYCGYFRTLLQEMISDDTQEVGRLHILSELERRQVLYEWNATDAEYPAAGSRREKCVHELFEEQVEKTPDAVAVVFESDFLSYAELNRRANQLAYYLRRWGIGPESLVCLCVERSVEMIVGLLGILKAGGAYVPLEPSYPMERLTKMLEERAPAVVFTHAQVRADIRSLLGAAGMRVINLDVDAEHWEGEPASNADPGSLGLRPEHTAYVIHTSGSTGKPKGVMNEHRAVVNLLLWMQEAYGLDEDDVALQKTPFSFDVSVWEIFLPLLRGAKLVLARAEGHKDPAYLSEIIGRQRVTTMHYAPLMLQVFLEHGEASRCGSLKRVLCGGESLPGSLARRFREELPHVRLYHLYGPTEAAVDVTAWDCGAEDLPVKIPIGRPIANTKIYLLDERGQPAPVGVAGELEIGGIQVARGYLQRPELTAERFVADPFAGKPGARMYKTGDLARWLPDGTIEFLGRNDFQVKIRGFRIELGEIEARLAEHKAVREAVVVAREDTPGDKRLVAYYTGAEQAEDGVGAEALRTHLLARLPEYMAPAAYVRLESLPLSPNGKLDRRALPAPEADAYVAREYEAPVGEIEQRLAGLWAELLKLERVGRHDNFFELGGHSLLAVTLAERMRRAGLQVDVRALFATPLIAALASRPDPSESVIEVPPNLIPNINAELFDSSEIVELRL